MSDGTTALTMTVDDAAELGEILEFLHDWVDYAPDALSEWLNRFTGGGYEIEELRGDLARFVMLLGGDGERFARGGHR